MMEAQKHGIPRRIRTLCKAPGASLLFYQGYHRSQLHRYAVDRAVILMYHRVGDHPTPATNGSWQTQFERGISSKHFDRHMRFIRREMTPMTLLELVERLSQDKPLAPRAVVVTFDDGYQDNFTHAYPILRRYDIPATIFVATAFIESSLMFWWDAIPEMLRRTKKRRLDLRSVTHIENINQNLDASTFPLVTPQHRTRAADALIEMVGFLIPEKIPDTLSSLQVALEVTRPEEADLDLMLTWSQIQEMRENGISIESHTHSHRNLARLELCEVENDLRMSKTIIEEKTGRPVYGLAYPWGLPGTYSVAVAGTAQRLGFRYACIVRPASVGRGSDPFTLSRMAVENAPLPIMTLDLVKAYQKG